MLRIGFELRTAVKLCIETELGQQFFVKLFYASFLIFRYGKSVRDNEQL